MTVASKALTQNEGDQELPRRGKAKGAHHPQTSSTRRVKGTEEEEEEEEEIRRRRS